MSTSKNTSGHKRDACISGGRVPLSDAQARYLRIFTVEHMTNLRYVAHRENVSYENVRQMRRKLIQLGYMDARYNQLVFDRFSTQAAAPQYGNNWCLNGLEYNVQIIAGQYDNAYMSKRGAEFPLKGSSISFAENTIKIKVGQVFESDHPNKAAWNASEYVFSLLRTLEARHVGLLLLKDGYTNVRRVKGEFARQNDRIALKEGAAQMRIHSGDDGKLRVQVDWSPGTMPEIEFMHSKHAQPDGEKYEDFLRDLVEKNSLKLSELSAMVYATQEQHKTIAQELSQVTTALKLSAQMQAAALKAVEVPAVELGRPDYFG